MEVKNEIWAVIFVVKENGLIGGKNEKNIQVWNVAEFFGDKLFDDVGWRN